MESRRQEEAHPVISVARGINGPFCSHRKEKWEEVNRVCHHSSNKERHHHNPGSSFMSLSIPESAGRGDTSQGNKSVPC